MRGDTVVRRAKSDFEALLGQLRRGTHAYMWVYYEHAYEWRENSASEVRIAAPRWRLSRIEAADDGAYRHAPVCSKALGLREVTPSTTAFPAYANTLADSLGLELEEGLVPARSARWFHVSRDPLEHQLHWTPSMAPESTTAELCLQELLQPPDVAKVPASKMNE